MNKVLILGNGNYASGIKSALNRLVGYDEDVLVFDFTGEKTPIGYKQEIECSLEEISTNDKIYCFTDIIGGTPYRIACDLKDMGVNMEVYAGCSIPMLVDTIINLKFGIGINVEDVLNIGKTSVGYYKDYR